LLAREDLAQVALLLGVSAVLDERGTGQAEPEDVDAHRGQAVALELLARQAHRPRFGGLAPVLLGPERRGVAAAAQLGTEGEGVPPSALRGPAGRGVGVVVTGLDGGDPLGAEHAADPRAQLLAVA